MCYLFFITLFEEMPNPLQPGLYKMTKALAIQTCTATVNP